MWQDALVGKTDVRAQYRLLRNAEEPNCYAAGMIIHPKVKDHFNEIIRSEMKKANFGNGRTVRNIYEQAFRHHAVNYYKNEDWDPDCIMAEDLENATDLSEKRIRMGFN